jgi:hypothetical protein
VDARAEVSSAGERAQARSTCAEAERAREVRWPAERRSGSQEAEEQLHGVQDDDVQGGHARCDRSCNAAAAGGPAQGVVESRVENVGDR